MAQPPGAKERGRVLVPHESLVMLNADRLNSVSAELPGAAVEERPFMAASSAESIRGFCPRRFVNGSLQRHALRTDRV